MDWEKISANDMTDKGLISKIHYTNSSYSSILNNPIKRRGQILIDISPKKTYKWPIST